MEEDEDEDDDGGEVDEGAILQVGTARLVQLHCTAGLVAILRTVNAVAVLNELCMQHKHSCSRGCFQSPPKQCSCQWATTNPMVELKQKHQVYL
jgi:hypothetical protein